MYYVLLALVLDMRLFGSGFRDSDRNDDPGSPVPRSDSVEDAADAGGGDTVLGASQSSAPRHRRNSTITSFLRSNTAADATARADELYNAAHRHPTLTPLTSQDSSVRCGVVCVPCPSLSLSRSWGCVRGARMASWRARCSLAGSLTTDLGQGAATREAP